MSTYCRVVIHRPWSEVKSIALKSFCADSIIPLTNAKSADFSVSAGNGAVALDEVDSGAFFVFVAQDPKFLVELSRQCDTKITAIAAQSGVGFVSILVAERGAIIRRFSECEGEIEFDEGELPDWDDQIRDHSWNAADALVGAVPLTPRPSIIGIAIRKLGQAIGFVSNKQPEVKPAVSPSGLAFGDPIGAIPMERWYAQLKEPEVVTCRIDNSCLTCILDNGEEITVSAKDIKKSVLNPFSRRHVILILMNGRTLLLPDSIEFSEIEHWRKSNDFNELS